MRSLSDAARELAEQVGQAAVADIEAALCDDGRAVLLICDLADGNLLWSSFDWHRGEPFRAGEIEQEVERTIARNLAPRETRH